jgi:hypothetical protein
MPTSQSRPLLALAGAAVLLLAAASPADAGPPRGYVVREATIVARAGDQTRAEVVCPRRKVPLGGGVLIASTDLATNANSSFPTEHGWIADIDNGSRFPVNAGVIVICAVRPRTYTVVESSVPNLVETQSTAMATCPGGMQPLGGGGLSTSGDITVNQMNSFPVAAESSWHVTELNLSSRDQTLTAFAVCGKLKGYTIVAGDPFGVRSGTQTHVLAQCPAPTVPIGGGFGGSFVGTINSLFPADDTWEAFVNNSSGVNGTVGFAVAVCAGS